MKKIEISLLEVIMFVEVLISPAVTEPAEGGGGFMRSGECGHWAGVTIWSRGAVITPEPQGQHPPGINAPWETSRHSF